MARASFTDYAHVRRAVRVPVATVYHKAVSVTRKFLTRDGFFGFRGRSKREDGTQATAASRTAGDDMKLKLRQTTQTRSPHTPQSTVRPDVRPDRRHPCVPRFGRVCRVARCGGTRTGAQLVDRCARPDSPLRARSLSDSAVILSSRLRLALWATSSVCGCMRRCGLEPPPRPHAPREPRGPVVAACAQEPSNTARAAAARR